MKRMQTLMPVPIEPELKVQIEYAAAKTRLSQADVMRRALRIGVPEVIKRLKVRRPRRSLVENLDQFVGLIKRDDVSVRPLKLK